MRDWIFVGATALYLTALGWAYMNRGSEKVITTLYLGVTALIGSLVAVTLFGSEPNIQRAFSTAIMIDGQTRFPFERLPFSSLDSYVTIQAREKLHAHPDLLPDAKKDNFAAGIYHQLLQRSIITWLEMKYPATWEADVFPMNLGESSGYMFQSKPVPSRVYSEYELVDKMRGNMFADLTGPFGEAKGLGLAVPVGTVLDISAPHADPALGETSTIRLHNKFCTLKIETRAAQFMVGAGSYRMLLGMTQDQAQQLIKTLQYTVIISIQFRRFLAGNPDMPKYKQWALDIADGLQSQLDERAMWSRAKEWMLLHGVRAN